MLPYPHDRVDGFVQLSDGRGAPFMTEFNRFSRNDEIIDALRYVRNFMVLMRRFDEINKQSPTDCKV